MTCSFWVTCMIRHVLVGCTAGACMWLCEFSCYLLDVIFPCLTRDAGDRNADICDGSEKMLVPRIPIGVSGTALAAALLRDGWSVSKITMLLSLPRRNSSIQCFFLLLDVSFPSLTYVAQLISLCFVASQDVCKISRNR